MTDNQDKAGNEQKSLDIWITPKEISEKYNIPLRQIYRWVERDNVKAKKENQRTYLEKTSLEDFLKKENTARVISQGKKILDSQDMQTGQSVTTGEIKSAYVAELVVLRSERDKLVSVVDQLRANELINIKQLGRLESKVEILESNIKKLEVDSIYSKNLILILTIAMIVLVILAFLIIAFIK